MTREPDDRREDQPGEPGVTDAGSVVLRRIAGEILEEARRALAARVTELHRHLHTCAASRKRCDAHSALVKRETGVRIDDPAIVSLVSRAVPAMNATHARELEWMGETAGYLDEVAKGLEALVKTAPEEANVKYVLDGQAAMLQVHGVETARLADFFARRHASSSALASSAPPIEDLALAAERAETWVRQQAPTCQCYRQVVVGILTHYGWPISGSSVQHKADALRHLGSRRRNRAQPTRAGTLKGSQLGRASHRR